MIVWRKTVKEYFQLLEDNWCHRRNLENIKHNLIFDHGIETEFSHIIHEAYAARIKRLAEIEWNGGYDETRNLS